jgi:hypothetical protein
MGKFTQERLKQPHNVDAMIQPMMKAIHNDLLKKVDSPTQKIFSAWMRKLMGIKTPEDIEEQNAIQYYIYLFLCETNYIFYLMSHGLYSLLHEFLAQYTPKSHDENDVYQALNNPPPLSPVIPYLMHNPSEITQLTPTLLEYLHQVTREEKLGLDLWIYTRHRLKEITFEHAFNVRENRHQAYQDLFHVLEELVDIKNIDEPFYQEVLQIYEAERQHYLELSQECQNQYINLDGSPHVEAMELSRDKVIQGYDALKTTIIDALTALDARDNHPLIKTCLIKANDIIHKSDQTVAAINHKFNTLKEILELRIHELAHESQTEYQQLIAELGKLIKHTHTELNMHLNEEEHISFENFMKTLTGHQKKLNTLDKPSSLQALLGECALDLEEFIQLIHQNTVLSPIASTLHDIQKLLSRKATQTFTTHDPVTQKNAYHATEDLINSLPEDPQEPIHTSIQQITESSQQKAEPLPTNHQVNFSCIKQTLDFKNKTKLLREEESPPPDARNMHYFELLTKVEQNIHHAKNSIEALSTEPNELLNEITASIQAMKAAFERAGEIPSEEINQTLEKIRELTLEHFDNAQLNEAEAHLSTLNDELNSHHLNKPSI